MSRKYKFNNKQGLYFVSFATVYWIDLFVREVYCNILVDNLNFYEKQGMNIHCWCIMPSHVHLIFSSSTMSPEKILGQFKSYTSKALQYEIAHYPKESRRAWLLWMMERASSQTSNVTHRMLWQHNNQPIELWSEHILMQKLNYIHKNPVVSGFVSEPHYWKYSSAADYINGKSSLVKMSLLW